MEKQSIQSPNSVLQDHDVITCLQQLHDNYVFTPADKAANNVIIICKHFHLSIIVKELGLLDSDECSPTYEKNYKSVSENVDSPEDYF